MYRKLIPLAALAALSLSLGACVSSQTSSAVPSMITAPEGVVVSRDSAISRFQQATVKACGFLPAANFLLRVASVFPEYRNAASSASVVSGVASSICASLSTQRYASLNGARVTVRPEVRGVPVEGRRVR